MPSSRQLADAIDKTRDEKKYPADAELDKNILLADYEERIRQLNEARSAAEKAGEDQQASLKERQKQALVSLAAEPDSDDLKQQELQDAVQNALHPKSDETIELGRGGDLVKNSSLHLNEEVTNLNGPGKYATSNNVADWNIKLGPGLEGVDQKALVKFINDAKLETYKRAVQSLGEGYSVKQTDAGNGRVTFDIMKGDELVTDNKLLGDVEKFYRDEKTGINSVVKTMKDQMPDGVRQVRFTWDKPAPSAGLKPEPAAEPDLAASDQASALPGMAPPGPGGGPTG